jgi:hypothetical protein
MTGRSTTRIQLLRDVAGSLRRSLPAAVVVALLSALVAAGVAAAVGANKPVRYTAAAEFDVLVLARAEEIKSLSQDRSLLAEQVMRTLHISRAGEYAARATPDADISGEWVAGPGFGEISYQVSSADPEAATAAAQAVYDNAGFLGFDLVAEGQPKSAMDRLKVRPAAPDRQSTAKTVAAGAVLGGFAGFTLTLLFAVPVRRARTD